MKCKQENNVYFNVQLYIHYNFYTKKTRSKCSASQRGRNKRNLETRGNKKKIHFYFHLNFSIVLGICRKMFRSQSMQSAWNWEQLGAFWVEFQQLYSWKPGLLNPSIHGLSNSSSLQRVVSLYANSSLIASRPYIHCLRQYPSHNPSERTKRPASVFFT